MSTTTIFAELLVIGTGAATWVVFLLLALADPYNLPLLQSPDVLAAGYIVAITYLLGVVTDRIADLLITPLWIKGSEPRYYHSMRVRIMCAPESVGRSVEYLRSRIRICRGWSLNAPLCAFAFIFYVSRRTADGGLDLTSFDLVAALLLLLLAGGCWVAGKSMVQTEIQRVRDLASFLESRRQQPSP